MSLRYGSGSEASTQTRDALQEGRRVGAAIPSFEEITGKYPLFAGAVCIFAAGSVVQGWGHAASDVDLYVVTDSPLAVDDSLEYFVRHVSTTDPEIRIVLGEFGAYRADIEVWTAGQMDEVIARFSADTPSQESPELIENEQDMLYRLASGQPLSGADWWQARKEAIDRSRYGLWLAENHKLKAETFIEDVGGLLATGDAQTAALAGQLAVLESVDALLAIYGDYSVTRKWMYRRVDKVRPAEISVADAWDMITMAGASTDPAGWAERAGRLAQRLLLSVEARAAR